MKVDPSFIDFQSAGHSGQNSCIMSNDRVKFFMVVVQVPYHSYSSVFTGFTSA